MSFIEETNQIYDEAGGHLCDTDQELFCAYLDRNTAEQQRLTKKIYSEFWGTPTGQKLKSCSTNHDATAKRLMDVFTQRFGEGTPLYIFRLTDCAKDLLDAEFSETVANLNFDPPEPSNAEKRAALAAQIRKDMVDPKVSSVTIAERRKSSVAYAKAWADANTPDAQPEAPKAPAETIQFAHMLNEHIERFGVPKPCAGYVTLEVGGSMMEVDGKQIKIQGKQYKYPVQRFRELADAAASHGLIE